MRRYFKNFLILEIWIKEGFRVSKDSILKENEVIMV